MIRAASIQASSAAGTVITPTDTFTPAPNALLVLWIGCAASPTGPTVSGVTGWGLTWTQQATKGVATSTNMYCYTASVPGMPTNDTFTITLNISGNVAYILDQVEGVDTTTPIITANIATNSASSGTASSLTYPQTPGTNNRLLYACGISGYDPNTPRAGWTLLSDQYRSSPSVDIASQISPTSPGTTGSSTFTSSNHWATIGLEVKDGGGALPTGSRRSAYDNVVLADSPVAYIGSQAVDYTANHVVVAYNGASLSATMPGGDPAWQFDGVTQYMQIGNAADLSPDDTGYLTVEAWLRPDVLQFTHSEPVSDYVHWLGKGDLFGSGGNIEWMCRMYNTVNSESRPNRISGYAFNPAGGFGIGADWQPDPGELSAGEWFHYVLVINTHSTAGVDNQGYPYDYGYVKLYINGVLIDQDALDQLTNPTPPFNILIQPVHGTAQLRIGTVNFASYFQGAIAKVAIFDTELSAGQVLAHYEAISPPTPPPVAPTASPQTFRNVGTPHFAFPFTFTSKGVIVVEQDSPDDVLACVNAIVNCEIEACPEIPAFGISDLTFGQVPLDGQAIAQEIIGWEPRAEESVIEQAVVSDGSGATREVIFTTTTELS